MKPLLLALTACAAFASYMPCTALLKKAHSFTWGKNKVADKTTTKTDIDAISAAVTEQAISFNPYDVLIQKILRQCHHQDYPLHPFETMVDNANNITIDNTLKDIYRVVNQLNQLYDASYAENKGFDFINYGMNEKNVGFMLRWGEKLHDYTPYEWICYVIDIKASKKKVFWEEIQGPLPKNPLSQIFDQAVKRFLENVKKSYGPQKERMAALITCPARVKQTDNSKVTIVQGQLLTPRK